MLLSLRRGLLANELETLLFTAQLREALLWHLRHNRPLPLSRGRPCGSLRGGPAAPLLRGTWGQEELLGALRPTDRLL